jgi:hypothetical protein
MKTKLFYTTLLCLSLSIFTSLIHAQIPNYIPSNGLIGWWPFNGNANDESGNGNNGSFTGSSCNICGSNLVTAPPNLANDRFNTINKAFNFSNQLDLISIPNNSTLQLTNNYTISLWINPSSLNFGSYTAGVIIQKWGNVGSASYNLTIANDGRLRYYTHNGTSSTLLTSNAILNTNNWKNIVITQSSNTVNLFINGVLDNTSSTMNVPAIVNNSLEFGRQYNQFSNYAHEGFIGRIDDIGFWNRTITNCEIYNIFNSQISTVIVNAGANQTICNGNSTVLSATGASTYTWNNNVVNNQQFTPTISQTYSVVGIDTNGCIGSDSVSIDVLENSTSTQTISALDNYLWPVNNQTYTQSGTYTQIIPNSVGCDSTITLNLTLSYSGVNELNPLNNITIQPNPTSDFIYINGLENIKDLNFKLYDLNGQQVLKDSKLTSPINIQKLPKGIYFLEIKSENNTVNKRIVKQ